MVIGAFGKLLPESWRTFAFGAVTAAGSFGQFLFSPLAVALIDRYGWQQTLVIFACVLLLIDPAVDGAGDPAASAAGAPRQRRRTQSVRQALSEAFGHRSYVLLVLGFFTCGFQLAFVTVHLPAIWSTAACRPRSAAGRWRSSACSTSSARSASGWLATYMPKRYILSFIYFARALSIAGLHHAAGDAGVDADLRRRHRPAVALDRAADLGPGGGDVRHALARPCCSASPSSATRSAASSASGSAASLFERTGSYDMVWWLSVLFGVLSAIINLPIVEKPVERLAPVPA